jgi:hypothetical protein
VNVFDDLKPGPQTYRARQRFVTRQETAAVLGACPNLEWRCSQQPYPADWR